MTRTLIVNWTVKPDEIQRVLTLLPELKEKSTAEPGNLLYQIYQSEHDPGVLFLHECYADADALDRHRRSEHYQHIVLEQINPVLAAREVIEVKPLL